MKLSRTVILLSLHIFFYQYTCDAQPIISQSESIYHGATITFTGSGFGIKENVEPLKFETFEERPDGTQTSINNPVPAELPYWTGRGGKEINGIPSDLTISGDNKRYPSSNRAAKAVLGSSTANGFYNQQIWHDGVGFSTTGKVYINMWIRWAWIPTPTYSNVATYYQLKAFSIATSHANGDPVRPYISEMATFIYNTPYYNPVRTKAIHRNGRVSHGDQSMYYEDNSLPANFSGWINMVLISDTGTNKNDASSTDGWRIAQISKPEFSGAYHVVSEIGMNYLDDETKGTHPIDSLKIGWFAGNNLQDGETTLYYDDIYMDNTFARVEIGNNQNYASCTHREIQKPVKWKDDSITIVANTDAFTTSEDLYLFIFNKENAGNITQGHKLNIRPFPTDGKITTIP